MLKLFIFFCGFVFLQNILFAKNEYFLTLRYDKVNLRQGPSKEDPIKIFYKKNFFLYLFRINQITLEKLKIMKTTQVGYMFLNFQERKLLLLILMN